MDHRVGRTAGASSAAAQQEGAGAPVGLLIGRFAGGMTAVGLPGARQTGLKAPIREQIVARFGRAPAHESHVIQKHASARIQPGERKRGAFTSADIVSGDLGAVGGKLADEPILGVKTKANIQAVLRDPYHGIVDLQIIRIEQEAG